MAICVLPTVAVSCPPRSRSQGKSRPTELVYQLAPIIRGIWRLARRAHGISRIDGGGCSGTLAARWRVRLRAGAALAALLMDRRRGLRWRARSRLERADSLRAAPS